MARHVFDMSLRLWSHTVPLSPLLQELDVAIGHLHVLGQKIASGGAIAGRVATRHYASVAPAAADREVDVENWLKSTLGHIESSTRVRDLIRQDQVEAVLWIAIFGAVPRETPLLDSRLITRSSRLRVKILIENYAASTEILPEKTWLFDQASIRMAGA